MNAILASREIKARLASQGLEVEPMSREAQEDLMRRDYDRWAVVARKAGITAD